MDWKNKKLWIGILVVVIVLVSGLWIWGNQVTVSGKLRGPMKISSFFYIETSQKLPLKTSPNIIPNPEKGITKEVLMSYVGKEIKVGGKVVSREIGKRGKNCEMSQIGCLRKVKVILPEEIKILEDKDCKKDSDCIFTQCCGCASICNKECEIKPKATPCTCVNDKCVPTEFNQQVTITTDKTEYKQGENITITVENNLDKSIWYRDKEASLSFWRIQEFRNDTWTGKISNDQNYQRYGEKYHGTQGQCFMAEFEQPRLKELKPGSGINDNWNQKICAVNSDNLGVGPPEGEIKLIDTGNYRFAFGYYRSEEEQNRTPVYSNEFTIKK